MQQARGRRNTSRGIVIHGDSILLIERWRITESGKKLHYFSIPGGKIEPGEIPEVTVVRELFEEASLVTRPVKLLAKQLLKNGKTNSYFLCAYLSGKPKLSSLAPEQSLPNNRSEPKWVKHSALKNTPLNDLYEPLRDLIEAAFSNNLPEKPLAIK